MFQASACTYAATAARAEHAQKYILQVGPFNEGGSTLDRDVLRCVRTA
jgi:hypothetical protein